MTAPRNGRPTGRSITRPRDCARIAAAVKTLKERHGSNATTGRVVGVSHATIGGIERRRGVGVTLATCAKLARALGLFPAYASDAGAAGQLLRLTVREIAALRQE